MRTRCPDNEQKRKKLLAELQEQSKVRFVSPSSVAAIYVALGEKDQAFAWLDKAEKARDGHIGAA